MCRDLCFSTFLAGRVVWKNLAKGPAPWIHDQSCLNGRAVIFASWRMRISVGGLASFIIRPPMLQYVPYESARVKGILQVAKCNGKPIDILKYVIITACNWIGGSEAKNERLAIRADVKFGSFEKRQLGGRPTVQLPECSILAEIRVICIFNIKITPHKYRETTREVGNGVLEPSEAISSFTSTASIHGKNTNLKKNKKTRKEMKDWRVEPVEANHCRLDSK